MVRIYDPLGSKAVQMSSISSRDGVIIMPEWEKLLTHRPSYYQSRTNNYAQTYISVSAYALSKHLDLSELTVNTPVWAALSKHLNLSDLKVNTPVWGVLSKHLDLSDLKVNKPALDWLLHWPESTVTFPIYKHCDSLCDTYTPYPTSLTRAFAPVLKTQQELEQIQSQKQN